MIGREIGHSLLAPAAHFQRQQFLHRRVLASHVDEIGVYQIDLIRFAIQVFVHRQPADRRNIGKGRRSRQVAELGQD